MKKATFAVLMAFFLIAAPVFAAAQGAVSFSEIVTEPEAGGVSATPAENWKTMQMKTLSGGAALAADKAGTALEFEFNGVAVAADVVFGTNGGKMSVKIDGKEVAAFDLYRQIMGPDAARVSFANNLAPGAHKLRIEVLADKHPKSLGSLVAIDTLRVASAPYGAISGALECRYNAGMPVMRARVTATGKDGAIDLVTGKNGEVLFGALAPGEYTLRAEHPGYITLEKPGLKVESGKPLELGKVIIDETPAARPLTFIRDPLGVRPVIVRPGDTFPIDIAAPASASGWKATLENQWANADLEVKNASFDSARARWTVNVAVPSGAASQLYALHLKFSGGEDTQLRAVSVVPAFKDSIRILHLTDVHVYKSEMLFNVYQKIVDEVNLINPDVVVVTGDLTDSNGYTDDRWPESDQYPPMLDIWSNFNVPTYIVAGNHDLSPHYFQDDYKRWLQFFDKIDYSFNVGGYHFTAFDDTYTMTSGMKDKPYAEDVFPVQLDWIAKDLAANAGAKMRILLFHVPLHNSKSKVKEIATQNGVKLAIYGHVHMNQVDKAGGVTYVQTGSAYEGNYRVLNIENGKIGEISAKKDGYSAFVAGTLKSSADKSADGRSITVKVKNSSARAFPGAVWRAEMPSATDYTCDGCTIVSRFANGDKTLVVFTFDVPSRGDITTILTAK